MEELPTLSINNTVINNSSSPSPRSSMSTTSIGGCDEVETKIHSRNNYYTMKSVTVRPYFKCLCERCGSEIPTENEWSSKCNKAMKLKRGTFCNVTKTKLLRVGKDRYNISWVETDVKSKKTNRRARGWVLSRFVNKRFDASPSQTRPSKSVEVDRTRSRSASVQTQESPFKFGDLVLVRFHGNAENWVRGEVRKESPLLILAEGASRPQTFHSSNIKNLPTRKFVTAQNVIVRTQKQVDDWGVQTLKPGTDVSVAYMEGFEGRITSPVNGWISMREAHSLNVVESDWTYQEQNPTIVVKNLPGDMTESKLRDTLLFKGYVEAFTVTFQRKGDEFRALVSLRNSRKAVSQLVEKKQITCDDQHLQISWDIRYLRNLAAWRLGQTLNK